MDSYRFKSIAAPAAPTGVRVGLDLEAQQQVPRLRLGMTGHAMSREKRSSGPVGHPLVARVRSEGMGLGCWLALRWLGGWSRLASLLQERWGVGLKSWGGSAFGQRDEFGFAGDLSEVAGAPVVFGLFDAIFR